jgi:membrane-bound ClpP family serine protease
VFVLPTGWGVVAILVGLTIELGEASFWIRVSKRARPRIGLESLVGAEGVALDECRPTGRVRVQGETWRATCAEGADPGEAIVVTGVADLTLEVRRK